MMARIRTIKPEFWTSEQVMECSTNARLLFIGLWNFADDCGRMVDSPKTIKAQIFPGDDISSENVRGLIDELSSNGLARRYVVDGKAYLLVTGWKHQKIDRPQPPRYPAPIGEIEDHSSNDRRMIATEGKGKERKEDAAPDADASASSAPPQLDLLPTQPEPPAVQPTPEADYFRRVKQICGQSAGGLGKRLLDAKGGSIPLARAAVEQASTKENPREYLGAIIRNRDGSVPTVSDAEARGRAW